MQNIYTLEECCWILLIQGNGLRINPPGSALCPREISKHPEYMKLRFHTLELNDKYSPIAILLPKLLVYEHINEWQECQQPDTSIVVIHRSNDHDWAYECVSIDYNCTENAIFFDP